MSRVTKRFGLPKEARIRRTKDYRLCYERGKKLISKNFILFTRPRKEDGIGVRVGVGVSKKIGKAVLRNRLKRLIKEFVRLNRHVVKKDLDLVIVPKKNIEVKKLKLKDIETELYPLLLELARSELFERDEKDC